MAAASESFQKPVAYRWLLSQHPRRDAIASVTK